MNKDVINKKAETIEALNGIIDLHESMRNHYFFFSPNVASSRRKYERDHSLETEFEYKGDTYWVSQDTRCTCHNVYYTVSYEKNGEPFKADIRFIKKVLRELKAA